MENPFKNQFFLAVLLLWIAVLGSMWAGRASAQQFKTLYSFTLAPFPNENNSDGRNPDATLFLAGNMLFGTASSGGQNSVGTIFGLNTDGSGFTPYFSFSPAADATNRDGGYPLGPVIFTGTALIGTASGYGTNSNGTVYELSLVTGAKVLHTFTGSGSYGTNFDGSDPAGGLVLSGTSLYGTAEGDGAGGCGTVFKMDDTSLIFTNLHSFAALNTNRLFVYTNGEGAFPQAGMVLSGNILYGTASAGGSNGNGTVFSMNTNGTGFTTLHHFGPLVADFSGVEGFETNSDGATPLASLVLTNNMLFGVASAGGLHGNGTVFSLGTNGMGFTVLHTFAPGSQDSALESLGHVFTNSDGATPSGNLVVSGGILYGTASAGGTNANGTIFSLATNGAGFATLYTFSATDTNSIGLYTNVDGVEPLGGLILSSNVLYGTAAFGGNESDGTVFSLSLPPQIGIGRSGTNVILTWSTNLTEFTLETTTNLDPPVNWVTSSIAPGILNGQYALTNSISGRQKFFRLSQ
jgi:uncharacterized repeat protein (TIGR03803 family)